MFIGEDCETLAAAPCVAPAIVPPNIELAGEARSTAPRTEATAQARKPWAVSRKCTSVVCTPNHFVRSRPARYPPREDEIIAMTMKYRPVPIWKVVAETPEFPHGETTVNPIPAPNQRSKRVRGREGPTPAREGG